MEVGSSPALPPRALAIKDVWTPPPSPFDDDASPAHSYETALQDWQQSATEPLHQIGGYPTGCTSFEHGERLILQLDEDEWSNSAEGADDAFRIEGRLLVFANPPKLDAARYEIAD